MGEDPVGFAREHSVRRGEWLIERMELCVAVIMGGSEGRTLESMGVGVLGY